MSIVAKDDIEKDEEIFVSYGYGMAGAPEWYRHLWLQYLRYHRQSHIHTLI